MLGPLEVIVWLAILVSPCAGISYQFVSTSGNNPWELPANWQPNGIPTSADDVIIPYTPSGFYSVSINSQATCRSLLIGGPSGPTELSWDPGNTQTLSIVSGTLSIATNATVLQSGVIEVIGAGLTGLSTEGMVMVKGGFVFGNGGTHTVTTIGIVILSGGYLSIAAEPSGVILSNGAHIVVEPQGNMTLMSNYGVNTDDTTSVYVANYGNLYIAPASLNDFSTKLSVPFMNFGTGNVYVSSGEVSFSVNSTWDGTLSVMTSSVNLTGGFHQFLGDSTIQGSGTLQIQNEASVTLEGPVTISNFVLALGSVAMNSLQITTFANFLMLNGYLSGTPTAIQEFTWAGGFISVSDLAVNILQIQGAFTASMTDTALIVAQQASFQDTTHLLLYNSSFTLQEGAHMEFEDEIFLICAKNDTTSVVQIGGTLEISFSSAPITLTCNLIIMSTGTIHTTAGLLDIQTPVTSSGTISIDYNSTVILETTSTFFVGSSLVGAGTLNCQSCTALISGTVNIGTLQFPAGTITVSVQSGLTDYIANVMLYNQSGSSSLMLINDSPANLNLTIVNMIFSGGNVTSNRNAQLNLQANLIITNSSTFTGLQPYLFTNVAYINFGYTSFYGNGALKLWEDNLFYNTPAGVISVTGGLLDVSQNDHVGYVSELRNEGKIVVDLGATAQLSLTLRNLGEVDVLGQLNIAYGFYIQENNAVSSIPTSGSILLSNPGLFLGGTITGAGVIEGTVTLSGGTMGVNDNTNLTIYILLVRGSGTLEVDVASTSMLKVQSLCQISGGNLVLYSSDMSGNVPASKQYVSAPSIIGSGFDNLLNASFNSTDGFSISNTSAGLFAFPAPRPTITSITPEQGVAGTTILLTGTDFIIGDTALNVSVLFQGVAVPTYIVNRVSVNATVPALTGNVSVTILSDGRISDPLIWSFDAPKIVSLVPQSGPTIAANLVTITGANFGEDATQVEVVFGSFGTCSISELTNSQIICAVPPGVGANVTVTVQANTQKTAPTYYTYYPPTLSSVYPSVLEVANGSHSVATITVTGDNLATSETGGNITILIAQHACSNVTQVSLTTFTCNIPSALATGQNAYFPVNVDVAGQRSSSPLSFYVFYNVPTPKSTNHWWPFPWWIFLIMGAALVVFLLIGVLVGCKVAGRSSGGGYEPISTDTKRRSIN